MKNICIVNFLKTFIKSNYWIIIGDCFNVYFSPKDRVHPNFPNGISFSYLH